MELYVHFLVCCVTGDSTSVTRTRQIVKLWAIETEIYAFTDYDVYCFVCPLLSVHPTVRTREILSKTLTQQTGSGMAQLCMWQLVVGFNLREMEAREDLRKNFNK